MVDFERTDIQEQMVATAREFGMGVVAPAEIELDRIADPEEVFASDLFWSVMSQFFELAPPKQPARRIACRCSAFPTEKP